MIKSAACRANTVTGPLVFPEGIVGITEQSATRSPLTPRTRKLIRHARRFAVHRASANRVVAAIGVTVRSRHQSVVTAHMLLGHCFPFKQVQQRRLREIFPHAAEGAALFRPATLPIAWGQAEFMFRIR
jgi:hypothetical protein